MFDMSVTPGNKFVVLPKDSAKAPPSAVTVRLSFLAHEPPQMWRLVSVGCANNTVLCARPTLTRVGTNGSATRINANKFVQEVRLVAVTGQFCLGVAASRQNKAAELLAQRFRPRLLSSHP